MPVLDWNKPVKRLSTEEWKGVSYDGGPAGGYIPNMSDEDAEKWRAIIKGVNTDHPQVEIRTTTGGSQLLLIVSLGNGYSYKTHYKPGNTRGTNVHMSMNGPSMMTFAQMEQMHAAVQEARTALEALPAPAVKRKAA